MPNRGRTTSSAHVDRCLYRTRIHFHVGVRTGRLETVWWMASFSIETIQLFPLMYFNWLPEEYNKPHISSQCFWGCFASLFLVFVPLSKVSFCGSTFCLFLHPSSTLFPWYKHNGGVPLLSGILLTQWNIYCTNTHHTRTLLISQALNMGSICSKVIECQKMFKKLNKCCPSQN